jgi:hypothetical protein
MSEMTPKQKTMVKARKVSRIIACLLLLGGGVILPVGVYLNSLQGVLDGIVIFVCAAPLFVVSSLIEKKLNV